MLAAATYFDRDTEDEHEIRTLADALYRRADWRWAQNGGATVTHGWKPESGFLPYRWEGYDEALLLYVLGLGSPTYPLPEESYAAWASTYEWKTIYGHEYLYSGPLFTHQLSHLWIDFRGIQDAFMRDRGIDYFENSRRATYVHQQYAIRNPLEFEGYGDMLLGDHGQRRPRLDGAHRQGHRAAFLRLHRARAPLRPRRRHDRPLGRGRLPAVRPGDRAADHQAFRCRWTWACSSPTDSRRPLTGRFRWRGATDGWVSPWHFGIDQGPIILMIENYRTGLLWRLMRRCPYIVTGLRRAGFTGGWL